MATGPTRGHPTPSANHIGVVTRPSFGAMGPRRWELVAEGARPKPANEHRRMHHHVRADYDALWRQTFGWLARKERIPRLATVIITVHESYRRAPLPDTAANAPTAKAAIDGLRDAGVIADDTGDIVRFVGFTAPERGDVDRFVLVVEEYFGDNGGEAAS